MGLLPCLFCHRSQNELPRLVAIGMAMATTRLAVDPTLWLWRHNGSSGIYREVCRATLLVEGPIADCSKIVVYKDELTMLYARSEAEFEDGRFKRIAAAEQDGERD